MWTVIRTLSVEQNFDVVYYQYSIGLKKMTGFLVLSWVFAPSPCGLIFGSLGLILLFRNTWVDMIDKEYTAYDDI